MKKITAWHGVDASNNINLFEYGVLLKWVAKMQEYRIIIPIECDNDGFYTSFQYSWWDANETRNSLLTDEREKLNGLAQMCGYDEAEAEKYLNETSDSMLLYDIIMYEGATELSSYERTYSENELKRKLNKALN